MLRETRLRMGLYQRFCEVHDRLILAWCKTKKWDKELEAQCDAVLEEIYNTFEEPTVETMPLSAVDLIFNKPYAD